MSDKLVGGSFLLVFLCQFPSIVKSDLCAVSTDGGVCQYTPNGLCTTNITLNSCLNGVVLSSNTECWAWIYEGDADGYLQWHDVTFAHSGPWHLNTSVSRLMKEADHELQIKCLGLGTSWIIRFYLIRGDLPSLSSSIQYQPATTHMVLPSSTVPIGSKATTPTPSVGRRSSSRHTVTMPIAVMIVLALMAFIL